MLSLQTFRSGAAGVPDLLNWAALVAPGVVLGKDGSLMAGFFFRGKDAASATNSERNDSTARMATYLAKFGAEWCMWVDAARIPSPEYPAPEESHFPDPISALIDAERREMFEKEGAHYETEYALILQYIPPTRAKAKLGEMMYDDDTPEDKNPGVRILANFEKRIADFENSLGGLLHLKRMGTIIAGPDDDRFESDQLANYLRFALTGEMLALRIPKCAMYMDLWIGIPGSLWTGFTPKLGKKFITSLTIEGFPSSTTPGILSVLDSLPLSYRWSSRFIFEDQQGAVAALKRYWKIWKQLVRGWWQQVTRSSEGIINMDALKMTQETEISMSDAQSGLVAFGYYTSVVVLMDEDPALLQEQAQYVKKEIERRGFAARIEEENANEAWMGSIPGHYYPNVRRPLIHSLNLADLLPLSAIWPGELRNPCKHYPDNSPPLMHAITNGSTPFRVNLHVEDLGHTLIFGPTRAGKSTALAMIAAQAMRYQSRPRPDCSVVPATISAFDKGRSLYAMCSAVGGLHYDVGADDSKLVLCPLVDLDSDSDRSWAKEWIGTCYELQSGAAMLPHQGNEVSRAIALLGTKPRDMRSLRDFLLTVQDTKLKAAMEHYADKNGMGHVLGGSEDTLRTSSFTVYEIDSLMAMGEKDRIPVQLYLFQRFKKTLTGQPAFLLLDEAHVMLDNPIWNRMLRTWLKELGKANCVVILSTQSLSDATRSGLLDVLIESCPTQIFLPNHKADMAEYGKFGLNANEVEQIKAAQRKKDYFIKSPLGSRMIELGIGPIARSFAAVSDKDTLREIKVFEAKYGENWPLYWLDERGVSYGKYTKKLSEKRAA